MDGADAEPRAETLQDGGGGAAGRLSVPSSRGLRCSHWTPCSPVISCVTLSHFLTLSDP